MERSKTLWPALGAAVLTASLFLWLPGLPASDCTVLGHWWEARKAAALYGANTTQVMLGTGRAPSPAVDSAVAQLGAITYEALKQTGWRGGSVKFARFEPALALAEALAEPYHCTGGLLLIVPGEAPPTRRAAGRPFLTVEASAANLSAALPLGAINAVVQLVEASRGRRLYGFSLEAAPLRTCHSGDGPCAVYEVSSGRVFLDARLANTVGAMSELRALLGHFTNEMLAQVQAGAAKLGAAGGGLASLANLFAAAGPSALALLMAGTGGAPLWFCIACPAVLGLLAPFIFNFGLTAAAEQVCQHYQLPEDQCDDLWWGAFALALILSLGSAIPIVYICRLPDCLKFLSRPY